MIDAENLNMQLKKEFEENNNYHTLERYVMSEMLSPIEDYVKAINLIGENINLSKGLNLYYIAAYLCAEWMPESKEFIEKLNNMIDIVENRDKAIIYYLNAYYLSCSIKEWRSCDIYRLNLLKSIDASKSISFVNNRVDLANISKGKEAESYLREAFENVVKVETEETLKTKTIDYWLSSQRFIDEFILGTHLPEIVYLRKFDKIVNEI